jgi:hypothetical protein
VLSQGFADLFDLRAQYRSNPDNVPGLAGYEALRASLPLLT